MGRSWLSCWAPPLGTKAMMLWRTLCGQAPVCSQWLKKEASWSVQLCGKAASSWGRQLSAPVALPLRMRRRTSRTEVPVIGVKVTWCRAFHGRPPFHRSAQVSRAVPKRSRILWAASSAEGRREVK